ncbi:MAG: OmpA family protein [Bacteroidales bacterium]|nr:OmpA family protein [Bacteroidales bacterium]
MNKTIILSAVSVLFALPAFAQSTVKTVTEENVEYSKDSYRVETAKVGANWFVGVAGGAQVYFGDGDSQISFGKRIAPALDVYFGKWFTPNVGLRFVYSGLNYKGGVPASNGGYEQNSFKFFDLHADALVNFCNLFAGYKPDRVWNCSPYLGVGYARSYDAPTKNEIVGHLGLLNAFRLSKGWDFTIDLRSMFVNDRFDKQVSGRRVDGALSLSFGFAYKFAPRGWNRSKTVVKTVSQDVSDIMDQLAAAQAERDRLNNEIDSLKNRKPEEIQKVNVIAAPYYVVFELGKSVLSSESKANLAMLAEIIKSNGLHYTVTGYADESTGNDAINQRLSRERAQAVFDCLVKDYKVPASLLKVDYKGGVGNMFYDDPSLSRAAITRND